MGWYFLYIYSEHTGRVVFLLGFSSILILDIIIKIRIYVYTKKRIFMEKFEKLSKRFFDGLGKSFSVLMPIFVFIFAIQIGVGIFSPAPEWVTKIAPEWIVDTGLMLLAMIVAFFAIILWIKRKKLDWY